MPEEQPVVVIGGSVAGLGTALFLARAGRRVEVLDRDPAVATAERTADPEPRRATAQAAHSHIFVARLRTLLAERAPDALAHLHAHGVRDLPLRDGLPPRLRDVADQLPDDPDLVALAARRAVIERGLRAAVLAEPRVRVQAGTAARTLAVAPGAVPAITGVELTDGSFLPASIVVDASGRRTPVPSWLAPHGIEPSLDVIECGISYFSRYYRLAPGAVPPPLDRGFTAGASFDRYSCLVFPGDGDTFSVTFGVLPEDRALRALSHPDAFDAAVAAIPSLAPWLADGAAQPLSDVTAMNGMMNRLRRWAPGRTPRVLGLAAVGDAAATSNPAHSRGCALTLVHAAATADAIAAHDDRRALAGALDEVLDREVVPWVADSVEQDVARLARWRPGSPPAPAPRADRLTNGELYAAAQVDPHTWHAFTRLQNLLAQPDDVLGDPDLVAHVRGLPAGALPPPDGPDHDELAALLAAHAGTVRRRGLVVTGSA